MITFGCEYEFGDIWRDRELPTGLAWNKKDYSIVSSTGIANDPKGLIYNRGGEINSDPTETIDEQVGFFTDLLAADLSPALNHRTNLHLHVRVPGLSEDLPALKKLLRYVDANQAEIYSAIEPVPVPDRDDYVSETSYKGALKRYKRRLVSHQYKVAAARVEEALQADTVEGFFDAHSRVQANGKRAYGLTTRAGINLLQLKETDTVEFRHFTNTLDEQKLRSCFQWVANFIPAAMDNAPVSELLSAYDFQFPEFQPYDHAMEVGYQFTNFDKLSRKVVEQRLTAMRQDLNLEECRAGDVVEWISKNDPVHVP
jgi:hypothetical protein